jgi:hypothetical protein
MHLYAAADRIIVKSEGIQLWLDAILPAYEDHKKDPPLQKAIETRGACRSLRDAGNAARPAI